MVAKYKAGQQCWLLMENVLKPPPRLGIYLAKEYGIRPGWNVDCCDRGGLRRRRRRTSEWTKDSIFVSLDQMTQPCHGTLEIFVFSSPLVVRTRRLYIYFRGIPFHSNPLATGIRFPWFFSLFANPFVFCGLCHSFFMPTKIGMVQASKQQRSLNNLILCMENTSIWSFCSMFFVDMLHYHFVIKSTSIQIIYWLKMKLESFKNSPQIDCFRTL